VALQASMGLALADSGTLTAEELLGSADAAMYV
jgi:predicted signal transduction protein with EAL and GGDEF domain